jgi:tRNA pseudouridine55 synthase
VSNQSGFVLIDKPLRISSAKALYAVKRNFHNCKVGHAGTLDPDASGLLVGLVGSATKLASLIQHSEKSYRGTVTFGTATSTDDAQGQEVATSPIRPSLEEIVRLLPQFLGVINQLPPQVSAKRIDGARAYRLVRQGTAVTLAPSRVEIYSLSIEGSEPSVHEPDKVDSVTIFIRCGSGTYIRSLARDLGQALGTCAHLSSLRRFSSGPFHVESAVKPDDIGVSSLLPWWRLFTSTPVVEVSETCSEALLQGKVSAFDALLNSFQVHATETHLLLKRASDPSPFALAAHRSGVVRLTIADASSSRRASPSNT